MERKHRILLRVFALALVVIILSVVVNLLITRSTKAQGFALDVPPYLVTKLPDGTELYKGVYQGCEYFLAVNANGRDVGVSVTTFGTGCK